MSVHFQVFECTHSFFVSVVSDKDEDNIVTTLNLLNVDRCVIFNLSCKYAFISIWSWRIRLYVEDILLACIGLIYVLKCYVCVYVPMLLTIHLILSMCVSVSECVPCMHTSTCPCASHACLYLCIHLSVSMHICQYTQCTQQFLLCVWQMYV